MAVYGRLQCKNGDSVTEFFPKTYANLVYMKGNTSQTVQSRISDIISGSQKVGSAINADNATNATHATSADSATSATSADKIDGYHVVIREKGYVPAQGNYTNTIVFIRQT